MPDDEIRKRIENLEEKNLSPNARRSKETKGRSRFEPLSFMRTEYMRDRDRIIHSKAFRRLKHKTQVFISPIGDHFVTRLTHTIEVSQIARSISRALSLNEDLTEAISLGHDLGHTPFGHLGEEFLDQKVQGGYTHAEQSLRVVDRLEKEGQGLNLTWEVRQGILHHSKGRGSLNPIKISDIPLSLEGQICRISDAIAYVNHDLIDAMRAGVIKANDIPSSVTKLLGETHSDRINVIIKDVIENSKISDLADDDQPGNIQMSKIINDAVVDLREYLFENVYIEAGRGKDGVIAWEALEFLWDKFNGNPNLIPSGYADKNDSTERQAADYLSGMTDHYAFSMAEKSGFRSVRET